jgi:demethylmenaquinone methyltransferase/2-methoxy-6-polyprenyl-1,4-benzoquinol methylase
MRLFGDVTAFDRFARPYDLLMPPARRSALHRGLACADRPVRTALDVAGGSGRAARAVEGVEWTVVDAAPGMTRTARGRGLPAVIGDATRLPVADASVDAVVVVDALHHVGSPRAVFSEVKRVLRPGGVLVVREFDPTTLRGRGLVAAERAVGFDSVFWTPDELARLTRQTGLGPTVTERGFGYTVAATRPMD